MNETESASYRDDNTPCIFTRNNIKDVVINLQNASLELFQWFNDNEMKANPRKGNLICSTEKTNNSLSKKLVDIRLESKFTFDAYINDICKILGLKLDALARITPHVDFNEKGSSLNAFFMSQFKYCQ